MVAQRRFDEGPMSGGPRPHVRVFATEIAELRAMSRWIRDRAATAGLADDRARDLELCLNELAVNIMRYAHADALRHDIVVRFAATRDGVVVEVEDDGRPFNPLDRPPLEVPRTLDDLTVGGYGIHIVRSLADRLTYRRDAGRNIMAMTFDRRP
jgi:anti-sigma regulatory factor (Ser/Thr protein kinase)